MVLKNIVLKNIAFKNNGLKKHCAQRILCLKNDRVIPLRDYQIKRVRKKNRLKVSRLVVNIIDKLSRQIAGHILYPMQGHWIHVAIK